MAFRSLGSSTRFHVLFLWRASISSYIATIHKEASDPLMSSWKLEGFPSSFRRQYVSWLVIIYCECQDGLALSLVDRRVFHQYPHLARVFMFRIGRLFQRLLLYLYCQFFVLQAIICLLTLQFIFCKYYIPANNNFVGNGIPQAIPLYIVSIAKKDTFPRFWIQLHSFLSVTHHIHMTTKHTLGWIFNCFVIQHLHWSFQLNYS